MKEISGSFAKHLARQGFKGGLQVSPHDQLFTTESTAKNDFEFSSPEQGVTKIESDRGDFSWDDFVRSER
jgi:hypothetical protein